MSKKPVLILVLSVLLATAGARGQGAGPYVNFETPVHDGLIVTEVGGARYLVVANSEDNAVEVYDTDTLTFQLRVPVGQEPVSVVAKPTKLSGGERLLYTANWLGDSLTAFTLVPAPGMSPPIGWRVLRTVPTGDEPIGIAIQPEVDGVGFTQPGSPFHEALVVTHAAAGNYSVRHPITLLPYAAGWEAVELFDSTGAIGIKEPRAVAFAPPTSGVIPQWAVLNLRGGNNPPTVANPNGYDYDLWVTTNGGQSIGTGQAVGPTLGDLGSANYHMRFHSNGELYVVGLEARNGDIALDDINGEQLHRDMETNETGFARSALWRVRQFSSATPGVRELDLNRDLAGVGNMPTCAIPTDVAIHERGPLTAVTPPDQHQLALAKMGDEAEDIMVAPRERNRIFVACMGSDVVATVIPNQANFPASRVVMIDTNPGGFSPANLGGTMRGPRALALKTASPARLYVYNRIEHSVTVINPNFNINNPASAVLQTFTLQNDPVPPRVRDDRKFLYTSKLSGGGKSACATCHIDGDSDQLAWNLSAPGIIDVNTVLPGALLPLPSLTMTNHKGPMVTQTLRGLINYEIFDASVADALFSNRPYHWRADKGFFTDFNAAFHNLMGFFDPALSFIDPNGNGALNRGIPVAEMARFRDLVNTITQEPNPYQPKDRTYSGSMFDGAPPPAGSPQEIAALNDPLMGTGGQRGLKLFHILLPSETENCVQCHALPEGSDNHLTEFIANAFLPAVPSQPMETAALRDMARKEKIRFRAAPDGTLIDTGVRVGEFGLVHTGDFPNTPDDSVRAFTASFGGLDTAAIDDISAYIWQLDSGVAPSIGLSFTVEQPFYSQAANQPLVIQLIELLEGQANKANSGVAVHLNVAGVTRGFWFDVTENGTQKYKEEPWSGAPASIGPLSRGQLLAFVDAGGQVDDHVTFHATPLGSDRRMAFLDGGVPGPLGGPVTPTNLVLEPLVPMSANAHVPAFTRAFENLIAVSHVKTRLMERAVLQFASGPGYDAGLDELRFEAPRRIRVTGTGIKRDAWLALATPAPDAINPNAPNCDPFNPLSDLIAVPLYPARDENDDLVWETSAELDPLVIFSLLAGWHFAPGVDDVLDNPFQFSETNPPNPNFPNDPTQFYLPGTFDPVTWAQYALLVANDLGTGQLRIGNGGCQRLTLQ